METLTELAESSICESLLRWQCDFTNDDELKTSISEVINYFDKLPHYLRENILRLLIIIDVLDGDDYIVPEARHIAVFVHENLEELRLYFKSEHFDFLYLLDSCGHKFQNLEHLQLPESLHLKLNTCEKMCQFMPNLKKLDISECSMDESSMQCFANLLLEEFYPPRSISDNVIKHFCQEDAKVKQSLRIFHVGSLASIESVRLILKSMPLMEDLYCPHSRWLYTLPNDMRHLTFNLKELTFDSSDNAIEDELEIAISTCPKVTTINVETATFSARMIGLLTMFKNLIDLDITVSFSNSETDHNIQHEDHPFDWICLNSLCFSSLKYLRLSDQSDCWISNGCLLMILGMCPNMEDLHLLRCDGFSNRTAVDLAQLMLNRRLTHLNIVYCNLLGPSGIEDLLRIPSLNNLRVVLLSSDVMKEHFLSNANILRSDATKYQVNMEIRILVSHDDAT